jgi:ElaB/YqjD/DUF883 family membrane-anchored ribosome-binding protein
MKRDIDLPFEEEESEEDIEGTARLRELTRRPERPPSMQHRVRSSMKNVGQQISRGQEQISSTTSSAVGQTSGYLREHNPGEVIRDVGSYARRHPYQAIGGAVVTGVVIGRLLK